MLAVVFPLIRLLDIYTALNTSEEVTSGPNDCTQRSNPLNPTIILQLMTVLSYTVVGSSQRVNVSVLVGLKVYVVRLLKTCRGSPQEARTRPLPEVAAHERCPRAIRQL